MDILKEKLENLYRDPCFDRIKILDIGGWYAPCRMATHMVDIMPYKTMNRAGAYGEGDFRVREDCYHQMDLGASGQDRGDGIPPRL